MSARREADRLERVTSDMLPCCPACQELSPPGASVCGECGSRLLVGPITGYPFPFGGLLTPGRRRDASGREPVDSGGMSRPALLCPTCLISADETGYCGSCGRQLMEVVS